MATSGTGKVRYGTTPQRKLVIESQNWIRLCAAIDGFRARYGRWPTRIRIWDLCLSNLRDNLFSPEDFAQIAAKLTFIEEGQSVIAEDETGATYDYGTEGFSRIPVSLSAATWLNVRPRPKRPDELD